MPQSPHSMQGQYQGKGPDAASAETNTDFGNIGMDKMIQDVLKNLNLGAGAGAGVVVVAGAVFTVTTLVAGATLLAATVDAT